jgi:hypothetical protein
VSGWIDGAPPSDTPFVCGAGGLGADCLVVDLVGVTFCGAAGVRAIARLAGALHGVRPLRFVIASGGCVERLLTLAELRGPLSDLLSVAGEGSGTSGNRRSGGELGARRLG